MELAGRGVKGGVERAGKPANEYLNWRQGLSPWKQARTARRGEVERRSKLGFYEGMGSSGTGGRLRRIRLGGVGLPGQERDIREAISRRGQQQAEAEESKASQEALLLEMSQAQNHDQFLRDVLAGNADATWNDTYGKSHRIGERSEWQRVAALGELARLGGSGNMRAIQEAHAQAQAAGGREKELMKKALDANADKLLSSMKHLYFIQGNTPAEIAGGVHGVIDGLKPSAFTTMDGMMAETLVGNLSSRAAAGDATAVRDLATLTTTYYQAATNESTRALIPNSVSRAMKAVVDGTNQTDINEGRAQRDAAGNPIIDPATGLHVPREGNPIIAARAYDPATGATTPLGHALIGSDPTLAGKLGHLHTHIDNSGNVSA